MFLSFLSIFVDILIFVGVLTIIITVASFFIVKDLQTEYKKVFRIQSKFDIELRKLVNLMFKLLEHPKLEAYNDVVIKQLPHEAKRNLLKIIEEIYQDVEMGNENHNYIVETYENLMELKRVRDSKIIIFNQKITFFPFNIYYKIMKLESYHTFTDKQ